MKHSLVNAKKLLEVVKEKRMVDSLDKSNSIELEVGDLVLVKAGNRTKRDSPYQGPYTIVDVDDLNVLVKIKNNVKSVHKNSLKKYNS